MRRAGTISEKQDAKRFADYLLTQGIASRVDEESDGWSIWIIEEGQLEQAKRDLDLFRIDPSAAQFRGLSRSAEEIRRAEKKREQQYQKNVVDVRSRWQRAQSGRCPVTVALIVICIAVALTVGLNSKRDAYAKWLYFAPPLMTPEGKIAILSPHAAEAILSGQVWRLVTPIFMHGDFMHIIFNLFMTFQLGRLVESRRGSWRFVLLVLATAIASNIGQYGYGRIWGEDAPYVTPFLGMSGVVYGVFGYAWMKSRFEPSIGIFIPPNFVVVLVVWLFLCMTGVIADIANAAHVVGLLSGMAIGYAPVWWREWRR